jgi:hypothetical protein
MEIYKELPFCKNYLCSNYGNVKSKRYNKPLKGELNNSGYKRVQIGNSNNKHFIHKLVALVFLKSNPLKLFVNHKDGNKLNNNSNNLEWVTRSENEIHAYSIGLKTPKKGENHHNSKLYQSEVIEIKDLISKGYNCTYISNIYNVNRKTISDIKNNKTWK